MLENTRKIENATKCKEVQKIVRKILQNAHFLASTEVSFRTSLCIFIISQEYAPALHPMLYLQAIQ